MLAQLVVVVAAAANGRAAVDREPPTIEHQALSRAPRGSPTELAAVISDPSGVFAPQVLVRPAGSRRYFAFPMEDRGEDSFAALVPQSFLSGKGFEYFIEAYDELGNGPARAGDPEKPFLVVAYDAPPKPARLILRTDPPDALVEVDGTAQPAAAQGLELKPGAHAIAVSAPSRRPALYQLDLLPGRELHLLVSLSEGRGAGTLRVQSDPPGAQVLLDAALMGTTPYAGPLLPGPHTLAVELAGHLRQEREVVLEAGHDVEQSFALPVLPRGPALSVESEPAGALLLVDGSDRGRTPWVGALAKGPHQLALRMQGRRERSADFVMPADRDLSLRLVLPEGEGVPQLVVSTQPPSATLLVDGKEAGLTPWSGPLDPGPHALEVRLAGFLAQKRTVTSAPNRDVEADFALVPEPGPAQLLVESDPPGAEVTLDDKPLGVSPATAKLEAGEHQIAAALKGRGEVIQRLSVAAGQRASVRLALPPAAARAEPVVVVNTQPAGALVALDGKPLGPSPARGQPAPGAHELTMSMEGYKTRSARFTMPDNRDVQLVLAVSLKPLRESESSKAPDPAEVARARVQRGRECLRKGDFACARTELESAYRLAPSAELLFHVAQARRKSGALADAAAAYRGFLKGSEKGSPLAAQAEKLALLCEAGRVAQPADEDAQPPAIEHQPVREAPRGQPLRLAAVIRDDKSGVLEPRACARNLYAPAWECLPLAFSSGSAYSAELPPRLVADGLAYYLEAYDGSLNGPARIGSPDAPIAVAMTEAKKPSPAAAAVPAQALPSAAESPGNRRVRVAAWLAMGGGAAAAITGGIFALSARNLTHGDTPTVVNGVTYHSITQANAQRASSRSAAADAFLAAGAALLVAGGAVLWLTPSGAGGHF